MKIIDFLLQLTFKRGKINKTYYYCCDVNFFNSDPFENLLNVKGGTMKKSYISFIIGGIFFIFPKEVMACGGCVDSGLDLLFPFLRYWLLMRHGKIRRILIPHQQ